MKKSLIALAAVAAVGAASAQSSVTISGRIDLGTANIKTKTTDEGVSTTSKTSTLAGEQHGRTTSRLTFSGTEDLGGGLKASFNYETRLNPDNTTTPGFDRTRNMFLNLSGGFGSVTIGTYLNSFDQVRGVSAATFSAPGGDFLPNHVGIIGQVATAADFGGGTEGATAITLLSNGLAARSTNAVAYRTPSFGGFIASVGVSADKASTTAPTLTKTNGVIGSVAYAGGPLNAQIAIGQGKASLETATLGLSSSKASDVAFVASYNLGVAVPYLQHERTKATLSSLDGVAVTANNVLKTSATEIGSRFPMGAFTPYVTAGRGKIELAGEDVKTSAFQVGTTYDLSKRTQLYAAVGQFSLKDDGFKAKTSGYKAGLIHNF